MKSRKNILFIFIIMGFCITGGCGQKNIDTSATLEKPQITPDRLTKITFSSKALKKEMKVNIYLPEGYSDKNKYPVLYLIHGYTGNEDSWMPDLQLDKKADVLIDRKEIAPLIIVAPQIDNSYGINSANDSRKPDLSFSTFDTGMYEDYLYKELVPYIDTTYSTITSREGRYIGGLSMGGWVALHMAFTHEDMFSKVGGHSPAIFLDGYAGGAMSFVYPTNELRNERDPIRVAQSKDLTRLKVYLDCGAQDSYKFFEGCDKLNKILHSKGVDSKYYLNQGAHDGEYWKANIEKYLMFYAGY
jgi:enterochelin esterase-like enzyme